MPREVGSINASKLGAPLPWKEEVPAIQGLDHIVDTGIWDGESGRALRNNFRVHLA